jgi:hypothetical protein
MSTRHANIDLGLEIIETVRRPGQCLSQRAIAAVCRCDPSTIRYIERDALKKLRVMARRILKEREGQ